MEAGLISEKYFRNDLSEDAVGTNKIRLAFVSGKSAVETQAEQMDLWLGSIARHNDKFVL